MAINNHRIFLYKPEAASVTADNAGPYLLGELIVDNLNVSIKLQEISTVTFTVPRIINNTANTRIDEVLDSYIIELWYGDLSGTLDTDYYKYRFTLYSTPINFSDNKIIHSYTGYSLEALTELKMLVSWPGVEISDFFRKVSYNNTTATPKFLEAKSASAGGGNFEYTITTSGSGADYITLTPTTAEATDIDIFIYEVRQALTSGTVTSESEAGLIPYSGTGPNDAGFKAGYYFLTISGGYVTQINIALPENYTDFNGVSVNSNVLFFKLYDNPLSRRYAIGITTNAEEANDMYMDLAHDVALGVATDFDDFNFQTQKFYSKNGLTLKQVLLGKENTTVNSVTEDGLLYSTGLTLGTIDNSLNAKYRSNLEFNNVSRYAAIKTLAESFDAIPIYDTVNNTVSFYPENIYGVNNGLIIRYGAYLKALNKEIDASKIITNAIGLGKDNLTISLVNPTGENYWEDYSYYLDDYYIESSSEIGAITEDANLGITFDYVSTSGYQSRWMSSTLAAKVAKWQYTRDWFHSILTGEYNASGFTSTITQFYNFYENRLEAIRNLIKKETQYYTALKKEVKYEAFKNYYDKLSKDNPLNPTYATKLSYYTGELSTAKTANAALLVIIDAARKAIFDENTAGSYAAKMLVLRGFLQKDSASRAINLDNLRPFQRETVVNDSSIDDEKDLLEIVKTHVEENKEPKVTISIDIASILAAQEAQEDWKKVKVGDKINIYLDELNVDVVAQIREINVDFEGHSLSFVISTVRNYNKGFGNFVLKTIRNLYNSNNNNVQYEIDGNRYSIETAGNVNSVLENGFNTADTSINSGLEDNNGNPGTTTGGAGTVTSSINEIDDLTESVKSYVSTDTQGVIIADGRVLAYHNYTSPTTYSSEIEMSAETGFTIRKIASGTVTKQVYIDTEGNAVFNGKLVVNGSAQTLQDVFDNIEDNIDAGTTVYRANDSTGLTTATSQANANDILLITGTFVASAVTYTKDDIYKFNGTSWDLDLDLKTKITGSVGGWTINSTDIVANNNKMTLHSDSDNSGWNPFISIGQSTQAYDETGAFMGIVGETGSGNGVARLSLKSVTNSLLWDGTNLTINGGGTFSGALSAATGSFTGSIAIGSGDSIFKADSNGIYLGDADFADAEFSVTPAGVLKAVSGTIAGWTLATDNLSSNGLELYSGSSPYLSIAQATNGYANDGIFLGIESSAPKFSMVTDSGSTFLKYDPSATYDLEIAGNAKIGPLFVGNNDSSYSNIYYEDGLTLYSGGTDNLDTDGETVTFNIDDQTLEFVSAVFNLSSWGGAGTVQIGLSFFDGVNGAGNSLGSYITDPISSTNVELDFGSYTVLKPKSVVVDILIFFTTASLPLSGISLRVYKPSIQINRFSVNSFGDVSATKLTLLGPTGSERQDKLIIDSHATGTSNRSILLSTPITALTGNRLIRLPDADGTLSLLSLVSLGTRTAAAGNGSVSISSISSYDNLLFEFIYFDATNRHISTLFIDKDVFDVSSTRKISLQTPGQTARVEVAYASVTSVTVTFTSAGTSASTILRVYGVI